MLAYASVPSMLVDVWYTYVNKLSIQLMSAALGRFSIMIRFFKLSIYDIHWQLNLCIHVYMSTKYSWNMVYALLLMWGKLLNQINSCSINIRNSTWRLYLLVKIQTNSWSVSTFSIEFDKSQTKCNSISWEVTGAVSYCSGNKCDTICFHFNYCKVRKRRWLPRWLVQGNDNGCWGY